MPVSQGEPYINLMFAVLAKARVDAERDRCNLMWADFQEDYAAQLKGVYNNIKPEDVAEWVSGFMLDEGVIDYLNSVKEEESLSEHLRGRRATL